MKNIFISGATGFIGQRLVNSIDDNIRVLSRRVHPDYETVICDLQSKFLPDNALDGVDTIFHLAAVSDNLHDTTKNQKLYQKVNIDATVRLAELAVKSNVKNFVFISSVKAGGSSTFGVCSTEKDFGCPIGIYGKSKREAELKLLKIGKESDMHISIIRPALVYGPGVKGNLKLMWLGIKQGWFPPLPETGNKRSMIHIDDLVRAILFVADDNRANGKIFIATDSIQYSSREIYNSMRNALGKSIPKWSIPKFLFDMVSLLNVRIKYKVSSVLGDEFYSSTKLEVLGFKTKKTFKDINETDF